MNTLPITTPTDPIYEAGYTAARIGKSSGTNPHKALTSDWSKWNEGFNHGNRDRKLDRHRLSSLQKMHQVAKDFTVHPIDKNNQKG